MSEIPDNLQSIMCELLLSVADDKLMLGHRNSDWTGLAPILEEDIAFSSIAQDEMAHASALYEMVGSLRETDADQLAFGRAPADYRCAAIVELHDEFEWATAVARRFFCDHFDEVRLERLAQSSWKSLSALAGRLAAEEQVHVQHIDEWVRRLGRGTDESRQRLQEALDALAPVAPMLLEPVEGQEKLEEAGLYRSTGIAEQWTAAVTEIAATADLSVSLAAPDPSARGGRRGVHTAEFTALLDEMCEVFRLAPDAAW